MTIYHKGQRLEGPCLSVGLITGMIFGLQWVNANESFTQSHLIHVGLGPIVVQFWWPKASRYQSRDTAQEEET